MDSQSEEGTSMTSPRDGKDENEEVSHKECTEKIDNAIINVQLSSEENVNEKNNEEVSKESKESKEESDIKTVDIPDVNEQDPNGTVISIQLSSEENINEKNVDEIGKEPKESKEECESKNEEVSHEEGTDNKVATSISNELTTSASITEDDPEKDENFVVVDEKVDIEYLPQGSSEVKAPLKWGSQNYLDEEDEDEDDEDDDDDDDDESDESDESDDDDDVTSSSTEDDDTKKVCEELRKWKSCSAIKIKRGNILCQRYRYPNSPWTAASKPNCECGNLLDQNYRVQNDCLTPPIASIPPPSSKSPSKSRKKSKSPHRGGTSKSKKANSDNGESGEKSRSKSPKGEKEKSKDDKENRKSKNEKEERMDKERVKEEPKEVKEEKKVDKDSKCKIEVKEGKKKDDKDSKGKVEVKEKEGFFKRKSFKEDKDTKPIVYKAPKSTESKKLRIATAAYSGKGRRKTNEDTHVIIENLQKDAKPQDRLSFFAVYDGHGGSATSEACKEVVHKTVMEHPLFGGPEMETAIREGFIQVDQKIDLPKGDKSGSTAVVGFLHGKTLYVADLGDSECVIGTQETKTSPFKSELLSKKHKPTDEDERQRIVDAGGMVVFGRIFGTLAVSRGFGDFEFKQKDGMYMSCEPFVKTRHLSRKDKFAIFACDGLWDKVTYEEAVIHVSLMLGRKTPAEIAESLYELSFGKGSLDNITVVLVLFEWG